MTAPQTIVEFTEDGKQSSTRQLQSAAINGPLLKHFQTQVAYLTGDLELPLEGRVPGGSSPLEYRIVSDLNSLSTFFYLHDEIIHVSLSLRGRDVAAEAEMIDTLRLLLLDEEDRDEPTEEERLAILASPQFDFNKIESRPVSFVVPWTRVDLEPEVHAQATTAHEHLFAAFCP